MAVGFNSETAPISLQPSLTQTHTVTFQTTNHSSHPPSPRSADGSKTSTAQRHSAAASPPEKLIHTSHRRRNRTGTETEDIKNQEKKRYGKKEEGWKQWKKKITNRNMNKVKEENVKERKEEKRV